MAVKLPPGFVLDQDSGQDTQTQTANLPPGFVLDNPNPENPVNIRFDAPNAPSLPGYQKTQAKIASRPGQFEPLKDAVFSPFQNLANLSKLAPTNLGMNVLGAAARTIEQPIANAGLALQEGRFPGLQDLISGVTGKKPGELGDIYRNVGVPEPLAATGGLLASAALIPGGKVAKGEKALTTNTKNVVSDIRTPIGENLDSFIDKKIEKSIRPSFSGKTTPALLARFKKQAINAVKTIVKRKDALDVQNEFGESTGKLPENLHQFTQAIDQVKNKIFEEYTERAQRAGDFGAKIDLRPIAEDILKQVNNKAIRTLFPDLIADTEKRAARLMEAGTFTPKEAQEAIEMMNASLKAFYKNPTPQAAANVVVDSAIASKLRVGLDTAVDGLSGIYQSLKNDYGSLRAIQDDVMKRALVDARKNNKGIADFGEILAKGDIVKGLLSLDAGTFAAGTVKKGLFDYFKRMNDPNRMVKNMFNVVERSAKKVAALEPKKPTARLLK